MQDGSNPSQLNLGAFVGTTNIWDVSAIYQEDSITPELKELLVRLYQNLNNISLVLNLKDTGYYDVQEFLNSQLFFPNPALLGTGTTSTYRQVFRMTVNFGALPNASTKSVPHNIQVMQGYTFTRIYGTASNASATSFIPLPYASPTLNKNIEINADNVNVNITTAIDYSAYTFTYVICEYIKN